MIQFLSEYANWWIGLYRVLYAHGTATDPGYILMGLVVGTVSGLAIHYNLVHLKVGSRRYWAEMTWMSVGSFFAWPITVAVACAVFSAFLPIFLAMIAVTMLLKIMVVLLEGVTWAMERVRMRLES